MQNDGKPFEERVAANLKKYGICYDRIHDQMSGLKGSTNPCDFTAYRYPTLLYIECKSCGEEKFDMLKAIRENQWTELLKKDKRHLRTRQGKYRNYFSLQSCLPCL